MAVVCPTTGTAAAFSTFDSTTVPENVTGTLWIREFDVSPVTLPRHVTDGMRVSGRTTWGMNDFLAYRYTRDPLLSDTCAKLMAVAGFDEARLFVWWGTRAQVAHDIEVVETALVEELEKIRPWAETARTAMRRSA